jgi:prephenate dehydrogenase
VTALFQRVAVLGLGLLGGSVALATRRRRVAARVAGATRRQQVLERALDCGAVDEVGSFEDAARDADLVVLATPVFAMSDVVRRIAPLLREGAILTDVGSVKSGLADMLPGLLPRGVRYVGAHPMAGSHQGGLEHARADLFEGAPCVVMESTDPDARARVASFWESLGARVVFLDPVVHDAQVAWMSHVPHVLAFAFGAALEQAPPGAFQIQGSGFRDFTRIARSDSELWADILTGNRKAIAAPLQAVGRRLAELSEALEAEDAEAVERIIAAARAALSMDGVRESDSVPDPSEPPTAERSGGTGE